MKPVVKLIPEEMMRGGQVGLWRQITTIGSRNNRFDSEPNVRWGNAIFAPFSEIACAKYLGLPWTGEKSLAHCDVGTEWQVRYTPHANGNLIFNADDVFEYKYILTTGAADTYTLHGWFDGREAKQPKYVRDNAKFPSWWVPQSDLHPMPAAVKTVVETNNKEQAKIIYYEALRKIQALGFDLKGAGDKIQLSAKPS